MKVALCHRKVIQYCYRMILSCGTRDVATFIDSTAHTWFLFNFVYSLTITVISGIEKWDGMFRICATDPANALELAEIHAHFDDSSYAFGKNGGSERCKILGFKLGGGIFKEIHVDSCDDENWFWRLIIGESGFDDNEYEISYSRFCSVMPDEKKDSRICVGDFDDTKTDLTALEEILIECAKTQGNITRVYEQNNCRDVSPEGEIKTLYEI